MSETRFRAWDRDLKRMFWFDITWGNFGHGEGWIGMLPIDEKEVKHCPSNKMQISSNDCEMMQYTGIKEICQDDVVLIPDTFKDVILEDGSGPEYEEPHLARVIFKEGCFGVEIGGGQTFYMKRFYSFKEILDERNLNEIRIIGNVWEDSELIE